MKKDKIKEPGWETLVKFVISFLMASAFLIPLMDTLYKPLHSFEVILVVFLSLLFLLVFFASKIFKIISSSLLIISLASFIYSLFKFKFNDLINDFFLSSLPALLIAIVTSIFFYIFIMKFTSFFMCFVYVCSISLGIIIQNYHIPIFSFSLLLVLLYIVFMLERNTGLFYSSSEENRKIIKSPVKMTFSMFITYVLLFVILTSSIVPSGPLLGSKADNIVEGIKIRFGELFGYKEGESTGKDKGIFDLSSIGFGNEDELGGDVTLEDHRVLTVYSKYSGIYLGAVAYDEYTGRKWVNNAPMDQIEIREKRYTLESVDSERRYGLGGLSLDSSVVVRHDKSFRTSTIFSPANSITISFSNSAISQYYGPSVWQREVSQIMKNDHGKFGAISIIPENGGYISSYYYLDETNESYENLLSRSYTGYLKDQGNLHEYLLRIPSYYNLIERSKRYQDQYLQIPPTLPKRVYDLAREITKDSKTKYEKIQAIEKYLRDNYTYTLTPGDLPEGYDFVDYFLFEKKEGYCTYYASAMTILLRTLGIPTRYVSGFVVREDDFIERERFEVLASSGHAWPEVYFEGIGFISFEPTSSFEDIVRQEVTSLSTPVVSTQEPSPEISPSPSPTKEPDVSPKPTIEPKPTDDDKQDVDKPSISLTAIIIILIVIALPILSYFIYILIRKYRKRKFDSLSNKDAIIYIFRRYEKLLAKNHLKRDPFATLSEYSFSLLHRPYFKRDEMKNIHLSLVNLFNQARYSNYPIDDTMRAAAIEQYMKFVINDKEYIGKLKFFFRTLFI